MAKTQLTERRLRATDRLEHRRLGALQNATWRAVVALLCWLALCLLSPLHAETARREASGRPGVLLLFSHADGGGEVETLSEAFVTAMRRAGLSVNDLFFEYLDIERNSEDAEYRTLLRRHLVDKYAKRPIALIVTDHQPALDFLLKDGGAIVPAAPVLTIQAPVPSVAEARGRRVVSQVANLDIEGTLGYALELFPQTQRVVFVAGRSATDLGVAAQAAKVAAAWPGGLQFEIVGDLSLAAMLDRAAHLPPHSVVIFTQYNRAGDGQLTLSQEVEAKLASVANAPVFGVYDANLAHGGIGGSLLSVRGLGASAAQTALEILDGSLRLSQPIMRVNNPASPSFDWQQVERWHGKIGQLPAASVFVGRPLGIWDGYKTLIIASLGVFLAQLLTIAALLISRRRRRVAENLLLASEDRFRSRLEIALKDKQQYEEGLQLLLKLSQQADAMTTREICAYALEVAVKLTRSRLGGLHHLDDARAWTLRCVCSADDAGDGTVFSESPCPPTASGFLADCVGAASPFVDNTGEIGAERGNRLFRRMGIAIREGDTVRMVIEVDNKSSDYSDDDGRQLMLVANMVQKILLRQRAEEALQESEARFRFIIDFSPALVWIADESRRLIWFNRTWLEFTGRSAAQQFGYGWTESVHADDVEACLASYLSHFDAREAFVMEYRLRHHDGEYRWVFESGQPRFDDDGEFKGYVGTCLDITERKRAELEREQFQTFFTLSLDMMCITGVDGYFKKVNPAFTEVLGYSEDELLARPCVDFMVAEDPPTQAVDAKLERGGKLAFENRYRCADGAVRRLSWKTSVDPLRGVSYATARDFTELRAAEEQLNKLWMAVEQTSQSIVITDAKARIEYANPAFMEISGYSAAEVLGQNPRLLKSGQTSPATYAAMWATLKRGDIWQGEFINARKTGEIYTEYARISPVRQPDGRITHYLAIQEDITERKRATEAIRESKALLQSVIDATPDWIYVKDREHRFMLVNEQCANAFGLTPAQMIGRHDTDFIPSNLRIGDSIHGIQRLHDDDDAVFAGQSIHHPFENSYFENGELRVFDSFKRPMRDSQQTIYGALCYRRDITERFNTEQEQKTLETQLRQAQKMELIGHLTGGIAHDFNNILAAVFGYAELIQMSPEIERNPQLRLYVQEILQAGIRAKELVAQLLTFSHRREAASEAINVAPIVKEVAKLLRSTMPSSISIECALADALPHVLISPVQLHQIVMNLGVNARDAMAGSGTIEIRTEQVLVDGLRACASCHQNFSGRYLMISVRDSGAGVPAENLPRIFDPFFTTKEVGRGSGLGLSVLHGIVHSANGHIDVLTAPGEGSEFRIYLPPQSTDAERLPRATKADSENLPVRGHVMVVDDEASIVRFMTVLLENLGCRVTGLTSPSEALRVFTDNPRGVDLVLTDQTMPELSGVELARAMLACRPDLPVILSTGYSNSIDEDTARQIGIRRFLIKPVPAKVLADVVAECLAVRSGA